MGMFNKYVNIARGAIWGNDVVNEFVKNNPQYEGKEKEILALHKKLLEEYHEYFDECKGLETFMHSLEDGRFNGKTMEELEKCADSVLHVSRYTIPGDYFEDTGAWMYVIANRLNEEVKYDRDVAEYMDWVHRSEERHHVPPEDRLSDEEKKRACKRYLNKENPILDFYHPTVAYSKSRIQEVEEFTQNLEPEKHTVMIPAEALDSAKHKEINELDMPEYNSYLYVTINGRHWGFDGNASIHKEKDANGQDMFALTFVPNSIRDLDNDDMRNGMIDFLEFKKCVKAATNEQEEKVARTKEEEVFHFKTEVRSMQPNKGLHKVMSNEGVAEGRQN